MAEEYNLPICFFMLNIVRRPFTAEKNKKKVDKKGKWKCNLDF